MFLTDLFNFKKTCFHEKISPNLEFGYCPDCGKLIYNEWYITRCACCGVKIKAMSRNGEVVPQNHYCTNCGSSEYVVEKLPKINFIDINFAVLIKREAETVHKDKTATQCWEERNTAQPKLLTLFL